CRSRVALTDEKQGFSRRLRESLKRAQPAGSGAAALAREFNLRYDGTPVTVQAGRRWVSGNALPWQDANGGLAMWQARPAHDGRSLTMSLTGTAGAPPFSPNSV